MGLIKDHNLKKPTNRIIKNSFIEEEKQSKPSNISKEAAIKIQIQTQKATNRMKTASHQTNRQEIRAVTIMPKSSDYVEPVIQQNHNQTMSKSKLERDIPEKVQSSAFIKSNKTTKIPIKKEEKQLFINIKNDDKDDKDKKNCKSNEDSDGTNDLEILEIKQRDDCEIISDISFDYDTNGIKMKFTTNNDSLKFPCYIMNYKIGESREKILATIIKRDGNNMFSRTIYFNELMNNSVLTLSVQELYDSNENNVCQVFTIDISQIKFPHKKLLNHLKPSIHKL